MNTDTTSIERIIAKIDNDFNPDNSDWIPRVGAWTIDALQQLNVLRTNKVTRKIDVVDRIVYSPCPINWNSFKLLDCDGCEIKKSNGAICNDNTSSTGGGNRNPIKRFPLTPSTADIVVMRHSNYAPDFVQAEPIYTKDYTARHRVVEINKVNNLGFSNNTYVKISNNKLELDFDTDCVYIEQDEVETYESDSYGCSLPIIPNNGLLIEAIGFYCIWKMLLRGYKHPVMNMNASQYGTNPYYTWTTLKDEAQRSVTIDSQGDNSNDIDVWRSAFFISTFNPKR